VRLIGSEERYNSRGALKMGGCFAKTDSEPACVAKLWDLLVYILCLSEFRDGLHVAKE
jgi:hypothetical protein